MAMTDQEKSVLFRKVLMERVRTAYVDGEGMLLDSDEVAALVFGLTLIGRQLQDQLPEWWK